LFEDNPNWSQYYAGGKEINEYVQRVADKYQTRQYMKFRHPVRQARWDEDKGTWTLTIHDEVNDMVGLGRNHVEKSYSS
jgi:cation diffusion facilitator CzcD-associated flavoprotein CzcO